MKRLILYYILSFFIFGLHAQQEDNYRPLVEEGKRWTYDHFLSESVPNRNYFFWYYLQGDTTIAGQECLKLYVENEYNGGAVQYAGALVETEKKVFWFQPGKTDPMLLYDFDCSIGEELLLQEKFKAHVLSIDTITDDRGTYRSILLAPARDDDSPEQAELYSFTWLEGVGGTGNLLTYIGFGLYNTLKTCEVNGDTLYQWKPSKEVAPGYHEMAVEGKTWNYIHHYVDENGVHDEPFAYVVKGDTLVAERFPYRKLYRQDSSGETYIGMMNEIGRTFLVRYAGSNYWQYHYQFERDDIGRVYEWASQYGRGRVYWMLHSIDTIMVNDMKFRRLTFFQKTIQGGTEGLLTHIDDGDDVWHEIWIEGVGSQYSGVESPVHEAQPQDDYTYLLSCYENGKCIFTAADFTTAIRNIPQSPSQPDAQPSSFYDLQGRRLSAPPARGMYIQDKRVKILCH
ncbi:MAG: hypothetical protein IKO12_09780 [Bacteroidaceae bacterium]|nr:hypothetical protein [Bacteroidaceae bacterium]